jgi:hypothetical protein
MHQRDFTMATKSVSLRRKKRYTTGGPGTERAWLRRVVFLCGLLFHFGWEQRRVRSSMRGLVPANE